MRVKVGIAVVIAAGWFLVGAPSPPAAADHGPGISHEQGPETCYLVADGNTEAKDGDAEDLLTKVDRSDPDPATNETSVGTGTGTFNIEAIALQPGTGVLFAADAGTIGILDTTTGRFTAIGPVGTGSGALGELEMKDIDGLSFDATTGFLYGTERRRSEQKDLFLRIDPATGALVPGAIAGEDYAVVNPVADLFDVDAIAVDPLDGTMFAVVNTDGRKDHLVRIDKATGRATDIGVMEAQDMEGLGFASGQLIGTTGKVDSQEGIWDIDKATGKASNRRPLDNGRDYESFDCLNAPNPLPPPPPAPLSCLVVEEDAIPDDPVDFPFTTTGGTIPADLLLDDDPASVTPNSVKHCDLPAGPYTVTQTTPAGWPLVDVSCTDPGGDTLASLASGRAAVTLAAGETVTCLFKNSPPPAPVRVPRQEPPPATA
ncbi:MAG: hypothetical protein M3357_12020, partial [Actinomycetota bacterium]|nr:hypothetical protein [Actinomycetota bacterium]